MWLAIRSARNHGGDDEKVRDGERFSGLCLRVDTLDELLRAIADRLKVKFPDGPLSKTKPDGTTLHAWGVPSAGDTWSKGLPNWYYHPEIQLHPKEVASFSYRDGPLGFAAGYLHLSWSVARSRV